MNCLRFRPHTRQQLGARHVSYIRARRALLKPLLTAEMAAQTLKRLNSAAISTSSVDDYRLVANITTESIPDNLKKDCILFFTPATEPLARKIAAESGGSVTLGDIRWKCVAHRVVGHRNCSAGMSRRPLCSWAACMQPHATEHCCCMLQACGGWNHMLHSIGWRWLHA